MIIDLLILAVVTIGLTVWAFLDDARRGAK